MGRSASQRSAAHHIMMASMAQLWDFSDHRLQQTKEKL
jgi:hypothetical protein